MPPSSSVEAWLVLMMRLRSVKCLIRSGRSSGSLLRWAPATGGCWGTDAVIATFQWTQLMAPLHRDYDSLAAAWQRQRSAEGARIKWMFTTERARAKMARAYPVIDL